MGEEPPVELEAARFATRLAQCGAAGARIAAHDWSATLGPIDAWPPELRATLYACLQSAFPMSLYWGPDALLLPNAAWRAIHPAVWRTGLGRPAREIWPKLWPQLSVQFAGIRSSARGISLEDHRLAIPRNGAPDSYWSYSLSPVLDGTGAVAGILTQAIETTERVRERRRADFLLALNESLRASDRPPEALDSALGIVGRELAVARCGYVETDPQTGAAVVLRCWSDGRLPATLGSEAVVPAGADAARIAAGIPLALGDVGEDGAPSTRAALVLPVIRNGRYVAALFLHDDAPRGWSEHDIGKMRVAANRIWQETTRARAEMALRDSERRYRRLFEQAQDIILTTDLDQRITACNPATGEALGLAPEALVGRRVQEFVAEDEFARAVTLLNGRRAQDEGTRYEVEVRPPAGGRRVWEVSGGLTRGPDGAVTGFQAIARDITDRRQAEEHQRLLIHELNHRVKNTLAIVQGLALQSFRGLGEAGHAAQAAFHARLAALAAAHDLLTREHWEGAPIRQLAERAAAAVCGDPERLVITGPDLLLPPKPAVALAMALHELCTNAAKYGALSTPDGKVRLGWETGEAGCASAGAKKAGRRRRPRRAPASGCA